MSDELRKMSREQLEAEVGSALGWDAAGRLERLARELARRLAEAEDERDSQVRRLTDYLNGWKQLAEKAQAENNELIPDRDHWQARALAAEGVVEKLPKTKDGVAVVPGSDLWQADTDGWNDGQPYACGYVRLTVWPSEADPEDCYSTREAALAARPQQPSGEVGK